MYQTVHCSPFPVYCKKLKIVNVTDILFPEKRSDDPDTFVLNIAQVQMVEPINEVNYKLFVRSPHILHVLTTPKNHNQHTNRTDQIPGAMHDHPKVDISFPPYRVYKR
jgi:hypothetical protein